LDFYNRDCFEAHGKQKKADGCGEAFPEEDKNGPRQTKICRKSKASIGRFYFVIDPIGSQDFYLST
jgi:hypothetical protein